VEAQQEDLAGAAEQEGFAAVEVKHCRLLEAGLDLPTTEQGVIHPWPEALIEMFPLPRPRNQFVLFEEKLGSLMHCR
jgi:hypothetical protein